MAAPLPAHEEKYIRSYVEAESRNADDPNDPDTKVTLVQKVSSYRLIGTDYDVAVSLQHDYNATEWDAEMLLDATAHVLQMYSTAIIKVKRKPPRRCPRCSSYRLVTDGDIAERGGERGWLQAEVCSACEYRGPESFSAWVTVST